MAQGDRVTDQRPSGGAGPPGVGGVAIPAGARTTIALVVLVGDLALFWLYARVATTESGMEAGAALVFRLNAIVGALLCLVLAILNLRRWPPRAVAGRPFSVLTLVTILKLLVVATAMVVLGAFASLNGLQLMIIAVVECLVILWLAVGTSRHLAGALPPSRG